MGTIYDLTLNNAIVNHLMEGTAESVRNLAIFGADEAASMVWVDDEGIPHTETLWHWSHRASQADGVSEWWNALDWKVAELNDSAAAVLLHERLQDAFRAAAASSGSSPLAVSWARFLSHATPLWSRPHMMGQLSSALVEQGDNAALWLRGLGHAKHVSEADWTWAARHGYGEDPLRCLLESSAFSTLNVLLDQRAEPVVGSNQESLLNQVALRLGWDHPPEVREQWADLAVRLLAGASPADRQHLQVVLDQAQARAQPFPTVQAALRENQLTQAPRATSRPRSRS